MRDLVRSAVGAECLLDPAAAQQYRVHGQSPRAVVAPRTSEEAATLMQLATREGFTVECAGAGTRLGSGNPGTRVDLVLTTAAMTSVTEYEPADLVISALAGASLAQLADRVAAHNQFIALDPAVSPRSTIGSTVATGAAGPLRYAHGTPRDQTLGLEIVTGDGRVLHFGGRVVKNVAGYDIVRIMTGSRGTLAFITRVSMRLKPQPEVDRTAVVKAGSFAAIADITDAIMATKLDPAAIEIVSEPLARQLQDIVGWLLLVRVHGNADAVGDAVARIRSAAGAAVIDVADGATAWRNLAALEAAAPVNIRFANLPSLLRDTTATALNTAELGGLDGSRIAMHAGDGIVRVMADHTASAATDVIARARVDMEQRGGTLIVDRMPNSAALDAFGHTDNLRLMTSIKQVFDPAGILGRSRFVV
jgi:glycolate oxidase FAD binding subunit